MSVKEITKVYKTQFDEYTVTETREKGETLYFHVENYDLRNRTTCYKFFDTMNEVNEMMASTDRKQLMLNLIESCEEEVTGYYGDSIYGITDSNYEKLAEVLLANLDKFK